MRKNEVNDEVVARSFRLVNDDGRTLATLDAKSDGAPQLILYDSKGVAKLSAELDASGSGGFHVWDDEHQNSASLYLDELEQPCLSLLHGDGGRIDAFFPDGQNIPLLFIGGPTQGHSPAQGSITLGGEEYINWGLQIVDQGGLKGASVVLVGPEQHPVMFLGSQEGRKEKKRVWRL